MTGTSIKGLFSHGCRLLIFNYQNLRVLIFSKDKVSQFG